MSECHCIIYHPVDEEARAFALEMATSGDASLSTVGLAMLGPCPTRVDTNK